MEITKDDFQKYVKVQIEGTTNTWDIAKMEELTGLEHAKVLDIMKNYAKYDEQFN